MAWEPYTDQQWQELTDAAPAIARGVAWISGPPSESEAELDAFVKLVEGERTASCTCRRATSRYLLGLSWRFMAGSRRASTFLPATP